MKVERMVADAPRNCIPPSPIQYRTQNDDGDDDGTTIGDDAAWTVRTTRLFGR